MNSLNIKKEREGGFTLLELLIVISIIAILSVALVLVLNPAEALRKSRDAQRISDLSTLKTALGLYLTSTSSPSLAGVANAGCETTVGTITNIYYSIPSDQTTITNAGKQQVTKALAPLTDGTGWIPVNFDTLTGGSPISNLPLDPTNSVAATIDNSVATNLAYRYACAVSPLSFEIDATLESTAYTVTEDKRASDGGNNANLYEVGTNLKILPNTTAY